MSASKRNSVWATPDDWSRQRQTITNLYMAQKQPLKDVDRIMRNEHGFYATTRMYKSKFAKWGLQKNQMKGRLKDEGAFHDSGKHRHPKHLQQKLLAGSQDHSKEVATNGLAQTPGVICKAPYRLIVKKSPTQSQLQSQNRLIRGQIPPKLDPSESFRIPEQCMRIIQGYVSGSSEVSVLRKAASSAAIQSHYWIAKLSLGRALVETGCFAQGFTVIDHCFEQYKNLAAPRDPWLIFSTYVALFDLARGDPRLADVFIRYINQLAGIDRRNPHPLFPLFSLLEQIGTGEARQHALHVIECFLALMEIHYPEVELLTMRSLVKIFSTMHHRGLPTVQVSDRTAEAVIDKLRTLDMKEKVVLADIQATKTGLRHAVVYFRQGEVKLDKSFHGERSKTFAKPRSLRDPSSINQQAGEVLGWLAERLAKRGALELHSFDCSVTACWMDIDACVRSCGDALAIEQVGMVLDMLKARILVELSGQWAKSVALSKVSERSGITFPNVSE